MAKISTKELFDEYFDSLGKTETYIKKIRSQVDRSEVYEYEKKIGKQLIDMDVDEIFNMLLTFNGNRNLKKAEYSVTYASWTQISSRYRDIFNYYIDNYEVIKNPFYDKRMKGTEVYKRLAQNKEPFTVGKMEQIISDLKHDFAPDRAAYFECIIRIFFDGFANAQELVMLDESMIDFKFKTITLPGRIIHLSDRTFYLLTLIHDSYMIENIHGDYLLESWHNHYFKYIVRKNQAEKLQEKDAVEVGNIINRTIIVNVKNKYGIDVNLRTFYLLGFYNHLVEKFGEERTYELITSVRNSVDANDLTNTARLYGVNFGNVTLLKKSLRAFIQTKEEE